MNQNDQNEIQIIDSSSNDFNQSNRYPRYPLAEESNYKDWLANCKESNLDRLSTPSSVQDAVVTSLNIFSYIFGFLDFGATSAGLGILGALFGVFWPSSNNGISEDLLRSIEILIDRRINEVERNRITVQFEGLRAVMSNYNTALRNWNANRNNPALQSEVRSRFDNADDAFAGRMPEFRIPGFEIQSLSVYAQAATLHLLLLRDAVVNGSLWGFDGETIESYYTKLVCLIDAYADHCASFYRQGLQELRDRGNWNAFNNYRRDMTITVLDIISLFSNYDPRRYTINTNTQLTREVYTEPVATPGWLNLNSNPDQFQQIENDLIRPLRPSSTLAALSAETAFAFFQSGQTPLRAILRTRTSHFNISGGFGTDPWQGSPNPTGPSESQLQFENFDVYHVSSEVTREVSSENSGLFGPQRINFRMVSISGVVASREISSPPFGRYITNISSSIPGIRSANPTASDYTHRLSSIRSTSLRTMYRDRTNIIAYGWTHTSLELTNRLLPNRITQIPAVKSSITPLPIVGGPGHTGGGLVSLAGYGRYMLINFISPYSPSRQRYRLRIRFVKDFDDAHLRVSISAANFYQNVVLPGSRTSVNPNLSFRDFRYVDVPGEFELVANRSYSINLGAPTSSIPGTCLIDKIEFIPVNSAALEYEGEQSLKKAKKAVDDLFTNDLKNDLKIETTDYDVDQAANLVECVPEELYAKEKMILLDEVKHAKQLSESRNLIQNGNFEFYTDKWTTSNNASIQADNPIFKGNYLNMPGARETEAGATTFPTYVFQKIDESKLKPYTRYKARGFVGGSKEVRLIVARYAEEVDAIMNVRNDLTPGVPVASCGEFDRCHPQAYPILQDRCHDDRIEQHADGGSHSCHGKSREKHAICHDSHQFDFHIDTGEVYLTENPGIWVLFKISSPEGYATLDNIELIEEGPLVGESLALVKKREKKWKNEMETKWIHTKEAYEKAKWAVDALFTTPQDTALKFETIISNIISAEHLVQSIPYVYNKWLADVPGMNYDIYTELKRRITQAYSLYERRNIIKNGDFHQGLAHWHATPHARVQQIDGTAVLVIPNWGSNVSQNLCVEHNRGYVLRVTAKKEDMGKGYVTISDCAKNTETLTFTSCDYVSNTSTSDHPRTCNSCDDYVSNESINDQPDYLLNQERNESRCYNRNASTSEESDYLLNQKRNEQWSNHSDATVNEQMNYVTRTIDFFPDTDRVRIDIGETEGIFKVESVELICMEGQ
ncbi:pesticidal protein [Bacillus thuringiensis]|uniref:Crystaline entomocidal protoxin n=4 Tax=Bacillus cereus group TaxID=86661 RepID=A0ABD6RUL3_BACTU|nr:insecticidal delta-endotoxin Cry8Ea1 family protein [Bacillus thuringiensis]PER42111.1 pesticidal protein [Bacillus thuringiensis]PEU83535.1 pesticidal protein [Bacillus thuringiensis]PFH99374.1 pesticidal protein [Bacillus thuringiensis]PFW19349.1 pesticidal protein [Bacillus thuringiensis]PGY73908.1 pesticidal protein [Bacillus thuringiensis]